MVLIHEEQNWFSFTHLVCLKHSPTAKIKWLIDFMLSTENHV